MAEDQQDAISTEIAELEGRMADTHAWARDVQGQERIRQLYELQENGAVRARAAPSRRQGEIEAMMADKFSDYWRGAQSERLQGEYRALMLASDAEAGTLDPSELEGQPIEVQGALLMEQSGITPEDVADWKEGYGATDEQVAVGFANGVALYDGLAEAVGDQNADEIMDAIFGLPQAVQENIDYELMQPCPDYEPASQDELVLFARKPAGKILIDHWGHEAAQRLGMLLAREAALKEGLSDEEVAELDYLLVGEGLSTAEREAVWDMMAG